MNEVIRIFNQIKETNSTNDKVEVVKSNGDNELFKQCLVFLLDNMVITGISNAKINKNVYGSTKPLNTFLDVIDYLSNNVKFETIINKIIVRELCTLETD